MKVVSKMKQVSKYQCLLLDFEDLYRAILIEKKVIYAHKDIVCDCISIELGRHLGNSKRVDKEWGFIILCKRHTNE